MARPAGYESPRLNRKPIRLAGILVGMFLFHVLTMFFMTLHWGPPAAEPWVEAGEWRFEGILFSVIALACSTFPSIRGSSILLIPLGIFLGSIPIYSPELLIRSFIHPGKTQLFYAGAAAVISILYGIGITWGIKASKGSVKGTSDWGKGVVLRAAEQGFILGRWIDSWVVSWTASIFPWWKPSNLLRYNGDGHLITVASTRSGKGVGTIVPNLLDHPGSVITTDPKAENWKITARYRRNMSPNHKTIALDPFDLTKGHGGGFNPLDLVDITRNGAVEAAQTLATELMGKAQGNEAFWNNEAKALLTTYILWAKCSPNREDHTLAHVRTMLSDDLPGIQGTAVYIKTKPASAFPEGMDPGVRTALQEGAMRVAQKQPKELGGVLSTLQSHTHIFSNPRLQKTIESTTFTKEDILSDNASIYVIVPTEHLVAYAPWIRATLTSIYGLITRDAHARTVKPKHRILFLMDEFANLGKIQTMLSAVSLGAGYGITLWLILQDFNQLKEHYGASFNSFVANSDIIQVFGIQDLFSCEQVTKMMGDTTVWNRTLKKDKSDPAVTQEYDEEPKPLMTADELRRLHSRRQIIFARSHLPVKVNKIRYYEDPEFMHLADPNPYHS